MTTNTQNLSTGTSAAKRAAVGAVPKRQKAEVGLLSVLVQIALLVWAVIILGPILWTLLASFKNNSEIFGSAWSLPTTLRWANYGRAWSQAHVGTYFVNSVIVVALSTFGTMLFGSMAAYVLSRYKFVGNRAIYYFFIAG